jgi:hypothetical protein
MFINCNLYIKYYSYYKNLEKFSSFKFIITT